MRHNKTLMSAQSQAVDLVRIAAVESAANAGRLL
jgi:hypothetical protein